MDRIALEGIQREVRQVHAAAALIDYVQALIEHSRSASQFTHGLSPRAGLAMLSAARAWALMEGRDKVLPEDVQAVLPGVVGHRVHTGAEPGRINGVDAAATLISAVPVP